MYSRKMIPNLRTSNNKKRRSLRTVRLDLLRNQRNNSLSTYTSKRLLGNLEFITLESPDLVHI
jgi:hypothetical protein